MLKFLGDYYDYPIVEEQGDIVPLLGDDFTRAVIHAAPGLVFDGTKIVDDPAFTGLNDFWRDKSLPKGVYKDPGKTLYTSDTLTPEAVREEAGKAGLLVQPEDAELLCQTMLLAAKIFSDVTRDHLQRDDFHMRIWQMWGPRQALLGRTPFLHIDRTHLTGLWYADRATAEIYTGPVSEEVWQAFSPQRKNEHQNDPVLRAFSESVSPDDVMPLPVGPLIITKNSKARDLSDPRARQSVCIHRSGNVAAMGQAGIVMVPKFME